MTLDTCCRYTGLLASGAMSVPGTGNGPFGAGRGVPSGIPKLEDKKPGCVVTSAWLITEIGSFRSCCS